VTAAPHGVRVEISGLTRRFGALTVVDDVSLAIEAGEFLALLGPSGSGKTTILMSVAGFSRPDTGSIRLGGRDVTLLPPWERNIGMVFQKYALFPHMTVAQNIAFPLLQRGVVRDQIRRDIAGVVDLVGLSGLEHRLSTDLSGGQQQRVALARALVYRPPLLLMDEPLGALDKKLRDRLQVEIKDIQRATGTTVLFVTHDQNEALSMADRLAVLNHGRIEQLGLPEDLYEKPVSSFVADFIGEANILVGIAVSVEDGVCRLRLSNGVEIRGRLAGGQAGAAAGRHAELVLRPTKIQLYEDAGAAPLSGTVTAVGYSGESVTLRLDIGAAASLTVRSIAAPERPVIGQRVGLGWRLQDARVFLGRA
jgi:ABC-type Fe3+/spermidine/putrescine transport system ATPase subunit